MWKESNPGDFWGNVSPNEHVVQIYDGESNLIDTLQNYVLDGIKKNECIILIATPEHIRKIEEGLLEHGIHLDTLKAIEQYITLDADNTLSKFMVDGLPDENLFKTTISAVFEKPLLNNYKIRAFGEMVSLLWSRGNKKATVELEVLWNRFCSTTSFTLFCAYPKDVFKSDGHEPISHICDHHSRIISGDANNGQIVYKDSTVKPFAL